MKIREATIQDIPKIKAMMRELYLTWHKIDQMDLIDEQWFASNESVDWINKRIQKDRYFVVEEEGVVAYAYAEISTRDMLKEKQTGVINELYVKPAYREKGIGKELIQECYAWFKEKECKYGAVYTHVKDDPANEFWKGQGYKEYNMIYAKRLS